MLASLFTNKLFTQKAMLDENSKQWLFDTFSWAIEGFDVKVFTQQTQLVLPNNSFYPGSVTSVHEMALNVFKHTVNYAGMQNWPLKLVEPAHFVATKLPTLRTQNNVQNNVQNNAQGNVQSNAQGNAQGNTVTSQQCNEQHSLRGNTELKFNFKPITSPYAPNAEQIANANHDLNANNTVDDHDQAECIQISYLPSQVNQPQDLISSFAQQLATLLVLYHPILPPGGKDFIPQATDVLACVLGFGVIFTNTAYQFRGGCGSCNNPAANRKSALPEHEMCYALALFCYLKQVPVATVLPQLKSHLRGVYKKMAKEIARQLPQSTEVALLALL